MKNKDSGIEIRIILLLALWMAGTDINAQTYYPFPTSSASWNVVRCFYFYPPGWHDEYKISMDGSDTIHNGLAFKKINISVHHLPGTPYDSIYPTEFFGGLREFNKQIFIWQTWASIDTSVQLIYDFTNTAVGDTIYTNCMVGGQSFFGHLITGKDSVLVGTQFHTRLHLQDPQNIYNIEDWIEGVGSSWGLPFATFWIATDNSYDLTCFYKNENLVYGNPSPSYGYCQAPLPVISCDSILSSETVHKSNNTLLNIFPNPSAGIINLSFQNFSDAEVSIYDKLGRRIFSVTLRDQNSLSINLRDFPPGVYLLKLVSEKDERAVVRKVVKL